MKKKLYISIIILLLLSGALGTISSGSREIEFFSSEDQEDLIGEIEIVNNSALRDFADEHGLEGNGTEEEPYLLENYSIDGSQERYGLYLSDIDLHFLVKNTHIYNTSQRAIGLFQVSNFTLEGCSLESTDVGVWIEDSSDNEILNNHFAQTMTEGIKVHGTSWDNRLLNNEFQDCGVIIEGDKHTMTSQEISGNRVDGDPLYYFKDETVKDITGDVGQIIIANSSGSGQKDIGPARIDGGSVGITIAYSDSLSIENVTIMDQKARGVHITNSEHIDVKNSTVKENREEGISLTRSTRIVIETTEISSNEDEGIYASSLDSSVFKSNNITSNGGKGVGIETPKIETDGRPQSVSSKNNTISKNLIDRSGGYGIHLSGNSFDNEIFLNALTSNRLESQHELGSGENQAFEELYNASLSNRWNLERGLGNYWGEWSGEDEDRDGIIDSPYEIQGSDSKDHFPLSSTVGPPEDVRVSPKDGAVELSWKAPLYSIFGSADEVEIYKGEREDNVSFYRSIEARREVYVDENVTNDVTYYYRFRASFRGEFSVLTESLGVTPDGTSPTIIRYEPTGEDVSVGSIITIEFSEKMNEESVNVSVSGISGEITREENIYHFEPDENLSYGMTYHVNVTGRDIAGNLLEGEKEYWSFTTISTATIRGRVVDDEGKPIEGVLITSDRGTQNITDSEGEFEIKLESGSRSVQISKSGYMEKEITLEIEDEDLGLEQTIEDIELEEEKPTMEASRWFLPLVLIAIGVSLLGIVAAMIFFLKRDSKEVFTEEEIYEDDYEDISQEEFEEWWDDEEE